MSPALVLLAACTVNVGSPTTPPAPATPATPATPAAPAPAAPAAAAVDPLAGKSLTDICSDQALSLVKWDYDQLASGFQGLCCGPGKLPADEGVCAMDWPFNDVPACEEYDRLRNSIYARYGYPFKDPRWKAEFERLAWYTRREDYSEAWLSTPAKANAARLKQLAADKVGCSP